MIPTFETLASIIRSQQIKCSFYKRCGDFLAKKPSSEKIRIMEETPYIIEPIRIFIKRQYPSLKYRLYFIDHIPLDVEEIMIRELPLHDDNDYKILTFKLAVPLLKNPKYLIISTNTINGGVEIDNSLDNIFFLLGFASYEMLRYHDIDGIKENKLADFRVFAKDISLQEKDRLLITGDIQLDLLGHGNNHNPKIAGLVIGTGEPFKFMTNFKSKNLKNTSFKYVMSNSIFNDNFIKEGTFVNMWYNKSIPQFVREQTILDVLCNPEHHHYYMGIKLVTLDILCYKYIKTANAISYYNLMILRKSVKYTKINICYPNLVANKEKVTIFTNEHIKKLTEQISVLSKEKNINIPKCHEESFNIYSNNPTRLLFAITILKYHGMFADYIINKYFDKTSLLDIGAGPLRRVEYYERVGFKHLVAIEPSEESIKKGYEKFSKCKELTLDYIRGFGDEPWDKSDNYKKVLSNAPYKSILFKFTIHYMVHNFNILFKNIQMVADADDCTIIVTCVNKQKVLEKIGTSDKYEVYDGDMPIYGIYNIEGESNDSKYIKKLFYFASVYGVENGSIEYLVDIDDLIKLFANIGFHPIVNAGFLDIPISELKHTLDKLSPVQRLVPELQHLLIFTNKQ